MTGWIEALAAWVAEGRPAVLVTVLRAEGSTPREAGAKMVVGEDALHGSIGGGHLELEAVEAARALLEAAARGEEVRAPLVRELALGPSLGQCCGGKVTLLLEPVLPPAWRVAVFGAGHVGRAVVRLLADLPCAVTWIDGREAQFPAQPSPRVRRLVTDAPADEVAGLAPGTEVLVMTHSHALDLEIVEAALRRSDLGALGLIGSRTKRARFVQRLSARGHAAEALARLRCPIGLPGIRGKLPAEIAIAVVAELLQRRGAGRPASAGAGAADERADEVGGEVGGEVAR